MAERQGRDASELLDEAEERAAEAIVRVAELEQELDALRAELARLAVACRRRKHA